MKQKKNTLLRTIAIFKFLESATVALGGFAAIRLLDPRVVDRLTSWATRSARPSVGRFIQKLLDHLVGVPRYELQVLGAGAFVLAAIFLAEAIGLWIEARWAEWLAVAATAIFIPLEILEIGKHATAPKVVALVVNALVVAYLAGRLFSHRGAKPSAP